jgi:allantoin racemase
MTRKILVINPNTSIGMTEDIKASAEKCKLADTSIDYVNPPVGPRVIETYLDESLVAVEILKIIMAKKEQYDAFIIACGDDPALFAARELTDKPVLAIGQTPMLLAPMLGRKFSIIGHWSGDKPRSEDKVAKYKLTDHLASIVTLRDPALKLQAEGLESKMERMVALGRKAIEEDGAEVLIFVGAAFAGMQAELSKRLGVPVLEGISCAVKVAENFIDLGLKTTRVGQYGKLPARKELVGFEEFQPHDIYSNNK